MWGTFDLVWFKVIVVSFSALVSKWPVSPKDLVIDRNGVKFVTCGTSNTCMGTLYLVGFKVILWSFSVLSQNGSRAKRSETQSTSNTYVGYI